MKKTLFAVCAAGAAACAAVAAEKPVIVPAPVKMTVTGGECSANAEPKFVTVASIPPEGYELSVKKDGVTVRSSGAAGAFYAKMTLAQLKSPGKKTIPCVEIKDAPQYKWRGLLIDECPQDRWKTCPKCQARMKKEGIADVHGLQPWITRHFVKFLAERGRRPVGWDEYLLGDVPKSAIGMSWRAGGGGAGHKFLTPRECVMRGHDLVMTPRTFCYLDYAQGLEDDPFQYIGGKVTLEKSYAFDPCEDIPKELRGHILGGQGNNWSEYTWNECDLDWKMWPRACAIAEAVWTGDKKPGFADFMRRMKTHRKRLVSQGVNCAPLR